MEVRPRPAIRHPLASGEAVVVYVVETRRFHAVSPAVADALAAADASGEWPDVHAAVARELAAAGMLEIGSVSGPDEPVDPADAAWWTRPMVHQLATPLQTPFDPSEPDAWEEPPQ